MVALLEALGDLVADLEAELEELSLILFVGEGEGE